MKLKLFIAISCLFANCVYGQTTPEAKKKYSTADLIHTGIACFELYGEGKQSLMVEHSTALKYENFAQLILSAPNLSNEIKMHAQTMLKMVNELKTHFFVSTPGTLCNKETYAKFLIKTISISQSTMSISTKWAIELNHTKNFAALEQHLVLMETVAKHIVQELQKLEQLNS